MRSVYKLLARSQEKPLAKEDLELTYNKLAASTNLSEDKLDGLFKKYIEYCDKNEWPSHLQSLNQFADSQTAMLQDAKINEKKMEKDAQSKVIELNDLLIKIKTLKSLISADDDANKLILDKVHSNVIEISEKFRALEPERARKKESVTVPVDNSLDISNKSKSSNIVSHHVTESKSMDDKNNQPSFYLGYDPTEPFSTYILDKVEAERWEEALPSSKCFLRESNTYPGFLVLRFRDSNNKLDKFLISLQKIQGVDQVPYFTTVNVDQIGKKFKTQIPKDEYDQLLLDDPKLINRLTRSLFVLIAKARGLDNIESLRAMLINPSADNASNTSPFYMSYKVDDKNKSFIMPAKSEDKPIAHTQNESLPEKSELSIFNTKVTFTISNCAIHTEVQADAILGFLNLINKNYTIMRKPIKISPGDNSQELILMDAGDTTAKENEEESKKAQDIFYQFVGSNKTLATMYVKTHGNQIEKEWKNHNETQGVYKGYEPQASKAKTEIDDEMKFVLFLKQKIKDGFENTTGMTGDQTTSTPRQCR